MARAGDTAAFGERSNCANALVEKLVSLRGVSVPAIREDPHPVNHWV
ncbi:MAG TPA: hypothetical protein VH701_21375 [Vicinamibacterales bacterium]